MRMSRAANGLEHDYLRALYELAGRKAKSAVPFREVGIEVGQSEEEAERACGFWADRGILEWTALGHIALTHMGLRRAERLAGDGPSFASS